MDDEGAGFGVPVAALASAAAVIGADAVGLLTKNGAFVALELTMDRWQQVGATLGIVRDLAAAHAVVVAIEADCEILTARPESYAGLGDDPPIIVI